MLSFKTVATIRSNGEINPLLKFQYFVSNFTGNLFSTKRGVGESKTVFSLREEDHRRNMAAEETSSTTRVSHIPHETGRSLATSYIETSESVPVWVPNRPCREVAGGLHCNPCHPKRCFSTRNKRGCVEVKLTRPGSSKYREFRVGFISPLQRNISLLATVF